MADLYMNQYVLANGEIIFSIFYQGKSEQPLIVISKEKLALLLKENDYTLKSKWER